MLKYRKLVVFGLFLIDFIFGDLKLSHNCQNFEHNIVSSANPG